MARPTVQYLCEGFVVSAGCVLFRKSPENAELQICLLYNQKKKVWLLPKGRKDRGESIEAAAVRETYEETGYHCELMPCRMPTRAPEPGVPSGKDTAQVAENATEPIAITVMQLQGRVKLIWWFVSRVKEGFSEKVADTQMANEQYESEFVPAEEAAGRLHLQPHREVVAKALAVVNASDPSSVSPTQIVQQGQVTHAL